jgi:cardiolipin synthase (CMP-forming)
MTGTLGMFYNNSILIGLGSLKRYRIRHLRSYSFTSKSVVVASFSSVGSLSFSLPFLTVQPTHIIYDRRQNTRRMNFPKVQHFSADNNENKQIHQKYSPTKVPSGPPPQKSLWTQLRSLPNMITLARMASTPVLCYWIVQEDFTLAISGCVVAAISDGLDGYLAKHYGGSTVLGTYLDPLADKVLINGLAVSLWYANILPSPLVALWAIKDIVLLSGTAWYLQREQRTINFFSNSIATQPLTVTPSLLGKVNTGLQFTTLLVGLLTPIVSNTVLLLPEMLQSLCWVTGVTTMGSVLSYTGGAGVKLTMPAKATGENGNYTGKYGKEDQNKSRIHKS